MVSERQQPTLDRRRAADDGPASGFSMMSPLGRSGLSQPDAPPAIRRLMITLERHADMGGPSLETVCDRGRYGSPLVASGRGNDLVPSTDRHRILPNITRFSCSCSEQRHSLEAG